MGGRKVTHFWCREDRHPYPEDGIIRCDCRGWLQSDIKVCISEHASFESHIRMDLREAFQCRTDKICIQFFRCGNPYGCRGDFGKHIVDICTGLQKFLYIYKEHLTFCCQHHRTSLTVEKLTARHLFQVSNILAYSWLGNTEYRGSLCEAALGYNRHENLKSEIL